MKAHMTIQFIRLLVFLALFTGLAVAAFGQEDILQGVWFDDDHFSRLTFNNGYYKVESRSQPTTKGVYTVAGNELIFHRTHVHSNFLDGITSRYGWFSREEMYAEFGIRFNAWFGSSTQIFTINGDILTLVTDFGEQQLIRVQWE